MQNKTRAFDSMLINDSSPSRRFLLQLIRLRTRLSKFVYRTKLKTHDLEDFEVADANELELKESNAATRSKEDQERIERFKYGGH